MSQALSIPYLDLAAQYAPIQREVDIAISRVFERNAFAGGDFVQAFEEDFADYCGCRQAIGVGSGTEALCLTLQAIGIGPGDEVITVPNSFFATAEAISQCGARPVFIDVEPDSMTMDPMQLEDAITPSTKAILPVHLHGRLADMDAILEIAQRHDLPVIEDAAQAHGAIDQGRRAGSMGLAGCFSFYPGKNLGAPGEAGAITTNDDQLAEQIRMLRDHGQASKHDHRFIGWNARMDGIQAAVLKTKLPYLDRWNAARRELAEAYRLRLRRITDIIVPECEDQDRHVYHVFALRSPERDSLAQFLSDRGTGTAIHYPRPIHLQTAYAGLGYRRGDLPVAEAQAGELLSLPMYPELRQHQLQTICNQIARWSDAAQVFASAGKPEPRLSPAMMRGEVSSHA